LLSAGTGVCPAVEAPGDADVDVDADGALVLVPDEPLQPARVETAMGGRTRSALMRARREADMAGTLAKRA
jgi:hypothetical protein